MNNALDGKVAVVTGSTQGLGAAIARLFVSQGARVVITGRKREQGEVLASELGRSAIFQQADLARVEDCKSVMGAALGKWGAVDVLINSAADTSRSNLETFDAQQFDNLFAINVRAPLLLAQAALPSLRDRHGTIINIGSVNAYLGLPNLLVYSATKGALMTASKNLACALQNARVRVFCLNVGWMDTEGERQVLAREGHAAADFIEKHGKNLPMKRLIRPEEVAQYCLFLSSPQTQVFSGAVIDLEQFPLGGLSYPSAD